MHLLCPPSAAPLRRRSGHARWVVEPGRHSGSHVGGAHGGVGSRADDDTVPGFGGGSSEVPGLGSGGGGFGVEQEPGAGSWLIPEVVRMAH